MTARTETDDPARLRRNVEFALRNSFALCDVVPMLESLARASERGSTEWLFAQQKLAELLVEKDPWRAAVAARAASAVVPEEDGSHALLGLALTLLGHYHAAAKSYRAALAIAPENPWYAHNLGHLLDVALDQSADAVKLLKAAHEKEPHVEIAASYAHALGRVGRIADAKKVLTRALRGDEVNEEHRALLAWLEDGAPAERATSPGRRRRKASQST